MTGMLPRASDARFSSPAFLPDTWIMVGLTASLLGVAMLLRMAGLGIEMTPALAVFAGWAIVAPALCYLWRAPITRVQRVARDFVEGVSLFAVVSLLGAIASYPLAAGRHPFVDTELEGIDRSLHFHWLNWYEWVAGHAWFQIPERIAYLSIFVTPALLIGCFAWDGRRAESRQFVATFWVAVIITLALFPLFPAAGPLATLWHGRAPYMPLSALYQQQVIEALRHHMIRDLDLGALHGLVCAPSFHAASAVIYVATAWRMPQLRWPVVGLNLSMLLATPIEGTHYLADILGGVAVACLALVLTTAMIRSAGRVGARSRSLFGEAMPVAAE